MTATLSEPSRRAVLASSAAFGLGLSVLAETSLAQPIGASGSSAIQPFQFHGSADTLLDLRRRVAATRWPERELVADATQGVQLATMQKLARYWATDHDWRKCEAKLNALPQFITKSTGSTFISFTSARSIENALPMIVTHGWPGSIIEQLKIIGPLTNPNGPRRERVGCIPPRDTFIAGIRLFRQANAAGWNPPRIARAWAC